MIESQKQRNCSLGSHGNEKCDNKIDGLVQDCSYSSALAVELLQFCTKPSKYILLNVIAGVLVKYLPSVCVNRRENVPNCYALSVVHMLWTNTRITQNLVLESNAH